MVSVNTLIRKKSNGAYYWHFLKDRDGGYCERGVWLNGICEENPNHKWAYHTFCGREDCSICGSIGSRAHFRRYSRGLPHISEMVGLDEFLDTDDKNEKWEKIKSVGYLVISYGSVVVQDFLVEVGDRWKEIKKDLLKNFLREQQKYIKRLLKRELGVDHKGGMRWHFGGDVGGSFHLHLNVLFSGSKSKWIDKDLMKRLKSLIEERTGVKVVHYLYSRHNFWKVYRWWRYISRPTFLLQNEVFSYEGLKGFHNVIWFGKWSKKGLKNLEDLTPEEWILRLDYLEEIFFEKDERVKIVFSIMNNRCPLCGGKLKWSSVIKILDDKYKKAFSWLYFCFDNK